MEPRALQAAGELGIAVCNVPGYGVEEVADTTMCLILNLYRRTYWLANMVKEGKKITGPEQLKDAAFGCARIRGDTLGIVGLGKKTKVRESLSLGILLTETLFYTRSYRLCCGVESKSLWFRCYILRPLPA